MERIITYSKSIHEAIDLSMNLDKSVYLMGLGVTDPKGVFGTTVGLETKYGSDRVLDMPVSENAMTGVAIGTALMGFRPILTHQRVDFMLLSLDQIINNAAKWHYMFGGQMKVPIVIRLLIGRGWGQGPQHSQSLYSLFSHIPGLKVVMPTFPYDAKGLLISAIQDNNPVIFFEHRWLHNITGAVPEEIFTVKIGSARIVSEGTDLTIISSSYMTIQALKAATLLKEANINAEVIDLRSLKPLDEDTIIKSIEKTRRLLVLDADWKTSSISSEILAIASEKCFGLLKIPPVRITFPEIPNPTSWALSNNFYPKLADIINTARKMFSLNELSEEQLGIVSTIPIDIPDKDFTGPF